jgi:hypothetical protein
MASSPFDASAKLVPSMPRSEAITIFRILAESSTTKILLIFILMLFFFPLFSLFFNFGEQKLKNRPICREIAGAQVDASGFEMMKGIIGEDEKYCESA